MHPTMHTRQERWKKFTNLVRGSTNVQVLELVILIITLPSYLILYSAGNEKVFTKKVPGRNATAGAGRGSSPDLQYEALYCTTGGRSPAAIALTYHYPGTPRRPNREKIVTIIQQAKAPTATIAQPEICCMAWCPGRVTHPSAGRRGSSQGSTARRRQSQGDTP